MIILKKQANKNFIVLNLTDPQLGTSEWEDGHKNRNILEYTITKLIKQTNPDLITVSGDLAWAGQEPAYEMFGNFIESFQIPWAIVWGNHDNQNGPEFVDKITRKYTAYPHFLFEKGDPALGNGNYIIGIEENGEMVEALFMMDSHDQDDYVDDDGNAKKVWSKLTLKQIDWLKAQTNFVKEKGCKDATFIVHIPIFAYSTAAKAAYKETVNLRELTIEESYGKDCWNTGYTDSVGVQHENIACYPDEDGVFSAIKDGKLIKRIIAGHDHVNNWIIKYDGITFVYALKTGAGCYWEPCLNGGTVFTIDKNGVCDLKHVYVDVSHLNND